MSRYKPHQLAGVRILDAINNDVQILLDICMVFEQMNRMEMVDMSSLNYNKTKLISALKTAREAFVKAATADRDAAALTIINAMKGDKPLETIQRVDVTVVNTAAVNDVLDKYDHVLAHLELASDDIVTSPGVGDLLVPEVYFRKLDRKSIMLAPVTGSVQI